MFHLDIKCPILLSELKNYLMVKYSHQPSYILLHTAMFKTNFRLVCILLVKRLTKNSLTNLHSIIKLVYVPA